MLCIAVATPLTKEALHRANLLDPSWIVEDPEKLPEVVGEMIEQQKSRQSSV